LVRAGGDLMSGSADENGTILVIDDDRTVHTYLRGVLAKGGFRIYTALDALQGSMMARQTHPDLVILDVAMPGGGGQAVLERLRNLQGTAWTPVLVYSALEAVRVAELIPGDDDVQFMSKPGQPDDILARIESLLGHA
jgi:DNA-binding response OmpR family regulator